MNSREALLTTPTANTLLDALCFLSTGPVGADLARAFSAVASDFPALVGSPSAWADPRVGGRRRAKVGQAEKIGLTRAILKGRFALAFGMASIMPAIAAPREVQGESSIEIPAGPRSGGRFSKKWGSVSRHVVHLGDTLWGVAARKLGSGHRWRELWIRNRTLIANPNWIFPGQVLALPSRTPSRNLGSQRAVVPSSQRALVPSSQRALVRSSQRTSVPSSQRTSVSKGASQNNSAFPLIFNKHKRTGGVFFAVKIGKLLWADDGTSVEPPYRANSEASKSRPQVRRAVVSETPTPLAPENPALLRRDKARETPIIPAVVDPEARETPTIPAVVGPEAPPRSAHAPAEDPPSDGEIRDSKRAGFYDFRVPPYQPSSLEAAAYSLGLPGSGQLVQGKGLVGAVFLGTEAAALATMGVGYTVNSREVYAAGLGVLVANHVISSLEALAWGNEPLAKTSSN